uniref:Thrombospondin type 1 domain containing 1 n=1 Tax=Haplochromis burtoni TaxID=8153 RepID=A0A3Q2V986_HAPBU
MKPLLCDEQCVTFSFSFLCLSHIYLCVFFPAAFAGLNIWPSLHSALSNSSVFVDFSIKSNSSTIRSRSLSLVNTESNTTVLTKTLHNNQPAGRVEFNCSCFPYAGTFRFLSRESTTWWWSSELQVHWPTFHIAVERAGNHSGSFQAIKTTFQYILLGIDSALSLEVSYMEYNQIGHKSINKVRALTRIPIKPLRSQSVELSCAFPFTDRDFIRVALQSPHTAQEVKSFGPLYLSRIFSYKLLVENANAYKSGCEGTMTVKLITPPCAHINGKVLLYSDAASSAEEPTSPPLAFNWLTQGENETEFNCSVFYPGRHKYCFRFVFNYSRSPKSWGPWQPWSVCSVSCGEGVRERVRECLLPSGVRGMQCTGMIKEQSLCSLEDCVAPSPSLSPAPVGVAPLGSNMIVVVGISLCLAVIMATVVVTVWRKFCQSPQCSSVRRSSMHSPGGRKLSDEASICGHSLQRPSLSDVHSPSGGVGVAAAQKDGAFLGSQPLSQTVVIPLPQDPERLSPTGQKVFPPIFGYKLAQQQLKEMKKKGLKEATQLYHVSSSPVHDTVVDTSASPTISPIPTPIGFNFHIAAPFSEPPPQTFRATPDRLSPRVELIVGPPVAAHASRSSSKWHDRTADWVEMVERSGLTGFREEGHAAVGNSYHKNPNFRRTSSFNDAKPQLPSFSQSRQFRERSLTQGKSDFNSTAERRKNSDQVSGIGGPAAAPVSSQEVNQLSLDRAEQNWNRRGPSPIQRNILARKLKEAQSYSAAKGRKRSSSFTASSSDQRKGRCHSLPVTEEYTSSDGSPYKLSEAEQKMLDLDLSSSYVWEEE